MKIAVKILASICCACFIQGCEKRPVVNTHALLRASVYYVFLERIKNDKTKNLYDDFEKVRDLARKSVAKNTYAYIEKYLNNTEPYESIVIVRTTDGDEIRDFFCFWVDYRRKELVYLVAPRQYTRLLEKSQWGKEQTDEQILKRIVNFVNKKEYENLKEPIYSRSSDGDEILSPPPENEINHKSENAMNPQVGLPS